MLKLELTSWTLEESETLTFMITLLPPACLAAAVAALPQPTLVVTVVDTEGMVEVTTENSDGNEWDPKGGCSPKNVEWSEISK